MSSPWGAVQNKITIRRGVHMVYTAGHGGFMISKKWAEKNLSKYACKYAIEYSGYLCFEEDCDFALVIREHPQFIGSLFSDNPVVIMQKILQSLRRYNIEYCLHQGILDKEQFEENILKCNYQKEKEQQIYALAREKGVI